MSKISKSARALAASALLAFAGAALPGQIVGVKVEPATARVGDQVKVTVEGEDESICGLRVEYGNGDVDVTKMRAGRDDFPRSFMKIYNQPGTYILIAKGGRDGTAFGCMGEVKTTVTILEAPKSAAAPALSASLQDANGAYDRGDFATAVRLYRLLADQGDAGAQFILGAMYSLGRGVSRDDAQAVTWYLKAAGQGHAVAQNNLGFMYARGLGVSQNDTQAHRWFSLAAASGHSDAAKSRDRIAAKMVQAQSAEVLTPTQDREHANNQTSERTGEVGAAQSLPKASTAPVGTAQNNPANTATADPTNRMKAAIATGNTNELARAGSDLNQQTIAAAPSGSNARAAAAANRVMAAAAAGNVDEMNRALAEMNQALAQSATSVPANSASPTNIPQGVPMQVTGGGNKDTGTAVGSGSNLSGANVDARKGFVPGTFTRCDPADCPKTCAKGEEWRAGKCVPTIAITSCVAPAKLLNGKCVVPGGGGAGGSVSSSGGASGGSSSGSDGGGGQFTDQDATSCVVVRVNAKNTSQQMTNICTRQVSVVWCLLPSTVSRKIGNDCGRDNRYFQRFMTLGPGEVYENSYSMKSGETFQYGACYGRTKQGTNGTFSCL